MNKVTWRILATVAIILSFLTFLYVYSQIQGPLESTIAVEQLKDSNVTYSASRFVILGGYKTVIWIITIASISLIWVSLFVEDLVKKEK